MRPIREIGRINGCISTKSSETYAPRLLSFGFHKPVLWWRRRDLNLRPRAYEFLAARCVGGRCRSLMSGFRHRQPKIGMSGCQRPEAVRREQRERDMQR